MMIQLHLKKKLCVKVINNINNNNDKVHLINIVFYDVTLFE